EFGCRGPRQTEQHAADDRRTRPRRPGDQRKGLRDADFQRVRPAYVVDVVDAHAARVAALTALSPEDDERPGDERARDWHRREQASLDRAAEGESEHGSGKKCDEQIEHEALRATIAENAGHYREKLDAIFRADGEDGACLDNDLEELRLVPGVT